MSTPEYHTTRLRADPRRTVLWQVLAKYLQRFVPETATVLDFGAGHCGFINEIVAKRKIAFDRWKGMVEYAAPDVETIVGHYSELVERLRSPVDVVFASNVFEHFSVEELEKVLGVLRSRMTARGRLILVQPNYHDAYRQYFDDYTHKSIWTHRSLPDFLEVSGFFVTQVVPRFLPLTVKSRLPVHPLLIRAYLASPIRPLAGQMLIVAEALL